MTKLTPGEFLRDYCESFEVADHHFTGPVHAQEPPGHGSVFHIEGRILAGLAAKLGGPILEIGAQHGISTRYLCQGLIKSETDQIKLAAEFGLVGDNGDEQKCRPPVYSVDVKHQWYGNWPRRTRVDANSATYRTPEPVVWAYIDGDHRLDAIRKDIMTARACGAEWILFHDTSEVHKRPSGPADGSDAREAALELGDQGWLLYDISTPCGMIWAVRF